MANETKKKKATPVNAEPSVASAPASGETVGRNSLQLRRTVVGTVVSDKMRKTIVVKVDRRVKHGMYLKYVTRSCRYKAHDETNSAKPGDLVRLVESRPLSRDKRWALQEILRRAGQAPEANV